MDKKLLIRHFEGLCSEREETEILAWVEKDPKNKEFYSRTRDLFLASSTPLRGCTAKELEIADKILKDSKEARGRQRSVRCFWSIAAGAVAACLIALLAFRAGSAAGASDSAARTRITLAELPGEYKHTIYTEKGVKSMLTLPDGSQVWLNSDTKIVFPDKFVGDTREVFLSGEAYFKVVHNAKKPLIVNTNRNFLVKVTGTEFNIRSYTNDNNARTTLYSGSIEMYSKGRDEQYKLMAKLLPCQSYVYHDRMMPVVSAKADTLAHSAWKRGCLVFDSAPMEDVFKELERWHGVKFEVLDPRAYHYQFNADFESESIVQILESIKFCTGIEYALKDNKVVISIKEKK